MLLLHVVCLYIVDSSLVGAGGQFGFHSVDGDGDGKQGSNSGVADNPMLTD